MHRKCLTLFAACLFGLAPCAWAIWPWSKKPRPPAPKETLSTAHHAASTKRKARSSVHVTPKPHAEGLRTGARVVTFDMGRRVGPDGNLEEAHRVYHVAETPHWNINLPWFHSKKENATPSIYTPPNVVPIPSDQRLTDAVAEANEARDRYHQAAKSLNDAVAGADALKEQTAALVEQKAQLEAKAAEQQAEIDALKAQLGQVFKSTGASPSPTPLSEAAKAAEAAAALDELKTWSQATPVPKR